MQQRSHRSQSSQRTRQIRRYCRRNLPQQRLQPRPTRKLRLKLTVNWQQRRSSQRLLKSMPNLKLRVRLNRRLQGNPALAPGLLTVVDPAILLIARNQRSLRRRRARRHTYRVALLDKQTHGCQCDLIMRIIAVIGIVIYLAGDIMTANTAALTSQLTRLGTLVVSTGNSKADQLRMNSSAASPIMMGVFLASRLGLSDPDACGPRNRFMAAQNRVAGFEKDQPARDPVHRRILTG